MIIPTYSQRNKQKTKQKQMREAFPYPPPGTRWAVMWVWVLGTFTLTTLIKRIRFTNIISNPPLYRNISGINHNTENIN